ncbi:PAS domain S-box [Nostoc sp. PCC 7524]|uniref:PAS domain S-box protein n=1 Tax=Nostoc sp. (strain ATCC 29411 / PCC 7524) TaxID=28072 RepID=UPI00029EE428|nr:PAS domain S-box protein [Nostoc sp. PCC 7524]AFY48435.1 PAS domain S-box [Nostoc sp. PCC 7524]
MPSIYPVDLPTIEQVMESYPLTVLPDTLLVDVIALMNPVSSSKVESASDFSSCVLVVEEKNLVGIFTLRDVVRLTGAGIDLSRVKISEVMTQPVISLTLASAQNALTALSFMRQHHIRHLPVVDEQGQLLGLITQDRIRQVLQPAHLLKLRCVTEVMVTEVIHALPTTSVLALSQIMSDRRISCVVIVAPQETVLIPVGIITEKDILKVQLQGLDIAQTQVQTVMSTPVLSISPSESLWTVHQLMEERGVRRLAVVGEQGQLQGLVTQTNLLQVLDPLEIVTVIQALQNKVAEQTLELRQTNQQLAQEVKQRRQVEKSLRQAQQELELRVVERTAELVAANACLQQREHQWQALFDHALDAIAITNDEGQYIDVNPAACKLFGVSREELLGSTIADFAPSEFDFTQAWQQFREQGQMVGKFSLHRPDGTVRETEFAAVANFIPHRHLSILRDVSDRQQAQAALRESEQRLNLALSASSTGMWDWNLQTNELIWSESMCYLFDLDPQTFDNRLESFFNFIHPEDRKFVEQSLMRAIDEQAICNIEFRVVWLDGTVHWANGKGQVFYDEINRPLRMIGVHHDITERKQAETALRASQQQLQAIIDNSPAVIYVKDVQGRHTLVNSEFERITHLTHEQVTNQTNFEVFPPNIAQVFTRNDQNVLSSVTPSQFEEVIELDDGLHTYLTVKFPLCASDGKPYAICGISTDITERKQSQEALKDSEQKLQAIINNCAVAIYMVDAQNRHLLVNRWYAELLSTTPENMVGKSIYEFWTAEIADKFAAYNQHVLKTKQLIQIEEVVPQADGLHTYITVKFPLCDATGKPYAVGGISTDISDRKLAEQKMAEQAALIDIATDAFFVRDLENRILFWSRGAEKLYGWTAEESVGKLAHELFHTESLSQLEAGLKTTVEQGSWQGELEKTTKTGKKIIVASRWTLINNLFGQTQSILAVNTDITEKKQLEQQFYRAQRLESVGTLASGIAHDLNNVFAPIMMIAQLLPLRCKNVDARTQELFQTLENSSKRGSDLVKQILTFARGTEGKRILLQPGHLLKELVKVIKQTFPKSIEIVNNIATNTLWLVQADPTQLDQVFMNLVVNARDAMPNGGKLTITAENRIIDETYARMHLEARPGDYIVVTVSDTGTGIPPEILERIFDPFFTTKEVGKGTGLGLSTALGIIKNHDGFVQVSTQLGKGTQLQVFLPRGEGTATEAIIETELPRGNGELILVVDDEAIVQQTIQDTLENHHYKTLVAEDGIEAIALYAQYQQEISVVLLDILMPNMNGLTAIRTLRSLNPKVKIIATSGLPANEQKAIAAGAEKFLSKPYTATDLLHTLSAVIGEDWRNLPM